MDIRTIIQQETVTREELEYVIEQWVAIASEEEGEEYTPSINGKLNYLDMLTQAFIQAKIYFSKKYNIELYNINTVKIKAEYDGE